jgi:hypothetical protein
MRWLMVVHHLPERTRLRTPVLRKDPDACARVADALAALAGVREVAVRPYTGSILVEHAASLEANDLVEHVRPVLGIEHVVARGERPPPVGELPPFSTIARELAVFVREVDRDIRRHSEGVADLGVLATLGFFTAGAAEVIASRTLPLPPWFNLAWWGFRLFMTTEERVIHEQH